MYRVLILVLVSMLWANASDLELDKGQITAHTQIFGDSNINPSTNEIYTKLSMDDAIESLRGEIFIDALSLESENKDRDAHMYEVLHVKEYKRISYQIQTITKVQEGYEIKGVLTLNGVQKEITTVASINQDDSQLSLKGSFSILLTQFDIKPPTLLFLSVRDQIDIKYNLTLKKR